MSSRKKKKHVVPVVRSIPGIVSIPHLPPTPDLDAFDKFQVSKELLDFRMSKQKGKEVQRLVQKEADRNKAKVLRRVREKRANAQCQDNTTDLKVAQVPARTQEECREALRKCVRKADVRGIRKQTLVHIQKLLPSSQLNAFPDVFDSLMEEVKEDYEESVRQGTVDLRIRNKEAERELKLKEARNKVKDSRAPWYEDFKRNQKKIQNHLHVLHPALRQSLSLCKEHLNTITLADCDCYNGEAIDLDSFCGNVISACEKTEEILMNDWLKDIAKIFQQKTTLKGERRKNFYQCASVLLSIQLRDLLMRSVTSYVGIFSERRRLPRIEMELVLDGDTITFSPALKEVIDMIASVVTEMNKLLREVPTMESVVSESSAHSFVQVTLDQEFIANNLSSLKSQLKTWLEEPIKYADALNNQFNFLVDGKAKQEILDFIAQNPKFEEICQELQKYNQYVERTQEISSLEYFAFLRLDCENVRRGLCDAARRLSNLLLKNVVGTYRKENERICKEFHKIERIALNAPKSTKEMIELGEYMLDVKNQQMVALNDEIEESKKHLLYLIDVHIFSADDLALNTSTLAWPNRIRPVFEQNTEIIEDCKAKFEENLQKKSEWIVRELEKLSTRVQELEELGEIQSVQQYTYEIRTIQSKLKQVEDTVCWVNEEEALFKFPQSSYQDVGDINTIQNSEGKMQQNIEPYARLFGTVLKWQKAEKKWTDGSFLELNAKQIEEDTLMFAREMENLQKLFKSKFKQQALDGDSKYAKMNLEDANPENLPPPLKICALTSVQIKSFRTNIPIIQCLCNPGIRQRHWTQMSQVIGFDITPNSGSSLRKVLRLNLAPFMDRLSAISVSATREHTLELALNQMKQEWTKIQFQTRTVRDTSQKMLVSLEEVQSQMESHLVKTQTMRGSPYFKAFEAEVLNWEDQLRKIQQTVLQWDQIQRGWLQLEAFFSTEEVVLQMTREANLFREVDSAWKYSMELVMDNSNVLKVVETEGLLQLLAENNRTLQLIKEGLDQYVDGKRKVFPRLFFLCRQDVLHCLCETREPSRLIRIISLLFPGIANLEWNDSQDILAVLSELTERLQLISPLKTREAKGCTEKWMMQLDQWMRSTMRMSITTSVESLTSPTSNPHLLEVLSDWPSQSVLVSGFVLATRDCMEAIKGGATALVALKSTFAKRRDEICKAMRTDRGDKRLQQAMTSALFQNLRFFELVDDLLEREVISDKDFGWKIRPRCFMRNDDVIFEVLHISLKYQYHYLGDCNHPVWTNSMQYAIVTFLSAFKMKEFPVVQGDTGVGKMTLIKEVVRLLGDHLIIRSIASHFDSETILKYIEGAAISGFWLCLQSLDCCRPETLSALSQVLADYKAGLLAMEEAKEETKTINLAHRLTVEASAKGFIAFTTSPKSIGRVQLPSNLKRYLRPIYLLRPDLSLLAQSLAMPCGRSKEERERMGNMMQTLSTMFPKSIDIRFLRRLMPRLESSIFDPPHLLEECLLSMEKADQTLCKRIIAETYESMDIEQPAPSISDELLFNHPPLLKKAEKLVEKLHGESSGIVLVGETQTGKTLVMKAAREALKIEEVCTLYSSAFTSTHLFGNWQDGDWHDGILMHNLRKLNKILEDNWLVLQGPLEPSWTRPLEQLLDEGALDLQSGEHFKLSKRTKVIFETDNLTRASPATLSRCSIFVFENDCLNWEVIFEHWMKQDESEAQRWKKGHEKLISGLFKWIVPLVIKICETKGQDLAIVPNAQMRSALEFFATTMNEAIVNLKEKKYLRSWIQAAFLLGITWSFGGTLDQPGRQKFDTSIRDALMGKSAHHPLPTALNNKFDVVPPTEGLIFDFVFDFKARGQWKQWSDTVKNNEQTSTVIDEQVFLHTIETARFHYLQSISESNRRPFLLVGPPGCGKTMTILSKLYTNEDTSWFRYTGLGCSNSEELTSWLLRQLHKRHKSLYGSQFPGRKGCLFLDDITAPVKENNDKGSQELHQAILQLIETNSFFNLTTSTRLELDDMSIIACCDIPRLPSQLLSRFCVLRIWHPSEEALVRFFSTTLTKYFKDRGFPPEVSSVIPTVIQSSLKIFAECKALLMESNKSSPYLNHLPNLRDVFRLIEGCSKLPLECAENKKLFTRLWVHSSLRTFYDRLVNKEQKQLLFQEIRNCVKSIFRENFDSAFEHLGKVEGHVTEFNMRNLLFGSYLPAEDGSSTKSGDLTEVQSFDVLEKTVHSKIVEHNKEMENNEITLLPNRFSLELTSHLSHVLSLTGGHAVIGGKGGEGRATVTKLAAMITGIKTFIVPNSKEYDKNSWRRDIGSLIKETGSEFKDTLLYVTASQLKRQRFILDDISSLLGRGDIAELFSLEERHKINEHVHEHLLAASGGGIICELTPAALYDIFVLTCKKKLHIIISYNASRQEEAQFFQTHAGLVKNAFHICIENWPEDALKKTSELLLEDLGLERSEKKSLIENGITIYQYAGEVSERHPNTLISPSLFIKCLKTFVKIYSAKSKELDGTKLLYTDVIERFNLICQQIVDLTKEKDDLEPQIAEICEKISEEESSLSDLVDKCNEKLALVNEQEKGVKSIEAKLNSLKGEYEGIVNPAEMELRDRRRRLQSLRVPDLLMSKTLKNGTPPLRCFVAALCSLLQVGQENKANAISEYWAPGKRLLMDAGFLDRLLAFDCFQVDREKIQWIEEEILQGPDWDISLAGKSFPPAEPICQWIKALVSYHSKKNELLPTLERISVYECESKFECGKLESLRKALGETESILQQHQEKLHQLEEECVRRKNNQNIVQEKLDRGITIKDQFSDDMVSAEKVLQETEMKTARLKADSLAMACRVTLLCSFPPKERFHLQTFISKTLSKLCVLPECDNKDNDFGQIDSIENIMSSEDKEYWLSMGLPNETIFFDNVLALLWGSGWPLLWDPEYLGIDIIRSINKDKSIQYLHATTTEAEEASTVIKDSMKYGNILVLHGITQYDSRLEDILARKTVEKDGHLYLKFCNELCPYSPSFSLYLVVTSADAGAVDQELLTKCVYINFSPTEKSLADLLLKVVFGKECPKGQQDLERATKKHISVVKDIKAKRTSMFRFLSTTSETILSKEGDVAELLQMRLDLSSLEADKLALEETKEHNLAQRGAYTPASEHAVILCQTVRQLHLISPLYQYSLSWFLNVFRISIENSNKSRVLAKRLRYLKDHLTYSLFCHVTQGLRSEDKMLFSFLLTCKLLISEGRLDGGALEVFAQLGKVAKNWRKPGQMHDSLTWLRLDTWKFFREMENTFVELEGLSADLEVSSDLWMNKVLAKEPDNLPLHEPWYTKANKFVRMLLIAALRPDKLLELVYTFVSEHIGYKFVERLSVDLGRILSDCDPQQPIVYLSKKGEDNAIEEITDFSALRNQEIEVIALGEKRESARGTSRLRHHLQSGETWLVLDHFHLDMANSQGILKEHLQINSSLTFHPGYRLWIVLEFVDKTNPLDLPSCLKLCSERPSTLRDSLLHSYQHGPIKSLILKWEAEKCAKREKARLLYCLAFLHSWIIIRAQYDDFKSRQEPNSVTREDIKLAVFYIKNLLEEDNFSVKALREIVCHCCYGIKLESFETRRLIDSISKSCLNEEAIDTNRFRFSNSPDYYVPNKTLYKDYIEFIKVLPFRTDQDVFDLEPGCQIAHDFDTTYVFMDRFQKLFSDHRNGDVVPDVGESDKKGTTLAEFIECHDQAGQSFLLNDIQDQIRALTFMKYQFALSKKVRPKEVSILGLSGEQKSALRTRIILQGAIFDIQSNLLQQKCSMTTSYQNLELSLVPVANSSLMPDVTAFECPLYVGETRSSSNLVGYITMYSKIEKNILQKMSIALILHQ